MTFVLASDGYAPGYLRTAQQREHRPVRLKIGIVPVAITRLTTTASRAPRHGSHRHRRPFWLWPNLLSLDAPAIAVLWQTLLLRGLGAHTNRGEPVVLALCVWLIYIADRTLDAVRPTDAAWEPERKTFYRRHMRSACAVALGLASLIPPLAYFLLRRSAFYTGLALAVALLCYLISVHLFPPGWRARWPRELAVAALFTCGTFAPIWADNQVGDRLWAPAIVFALLCWVNCAAIETWEWQREPADREQAPSQFTVWIARHLFTAGLAISGLALLTGRLAVAPVGFSTAATLSGVALAAVAIWRSRVSLDAFRVAVDVALCTPLLLLFLPIAK